MTRAFPQGPLTRIIEDSSHLLHGHTAVSCIDVMHFIGVISTDWNFCEKRLDAILVHFVGYSLGHQITSQLGNQSKSDIVLLAVKKFEKNIKAKKLTEFAIKSFNKLRAVRNAIIHSHYVNTVNRGRTINFTRETSSGQFVDLSLSRKKLREIADAFASMRLFLVSLSLFYSGRSYNKRRVLPKIFVMPDIRLQPRVVAKKAPKRRPKVSLAKAPPKT